MNYQILEQQWLESGITKFMSKDIYIRRMLDIEFDMKESIKFYESMYLSYKKMLEDTFKDKKSFPIGDPFVESYKEDLRSGKNSSERALKVAQQKLTEYRWGYQSTFNWTSWLSNQSISI